MLKYWKIPTMTGSEKVEEEQNKPINRINKTKPKKVNQIEDVPSNNYLK